ncbi:peptidoglycan/LPS O-acetylase OafA/YrhL [Murinocardiopsis flavida]|uniref:Peptidoglycan/LPS O-acetylase OafA/YrhL n=1 Tax=Murinocardiopsis flavida TaxID=645275 RepID=A0A2P8C8W1_9ACTN|nr:acyltransferase family protein [Murinocardiopsis flavida]PSK81398.1 peptidoglycan/LPS O-acetylase OafA/YrhL [Murinocardiopsis flavida]
MTEQTRPPRDAAPPVPAAAPAPRQRLYYLDNLRILLTVLVLLHHVGVTYGNIPLWFYTEPAEDPSGAALDLLVVMNQMYFMGFFFLISGFFTPGSFDRKGGRAFLRGRLVRLGIPLLAFILLLRPMVNFGLFDPVRAAFAEQGSELPYWLFYVITWDPGPMWFAEVLLVFALCYALLRRLRPGPAEGHGAAAGRAPGFWAIAGFTVALGVVSFAWRLLVPAGTFWPVIGLPTPSHLPQYAALFVVGALAFRQGWFAALPRSAAWIGFASAAVGLAVFASGGMLLTTGRPPQLLADALGESIVAVGLIVGLLVLFRERFNRQGAAARFLSDHAFTVYIIHPLILVGLGYAFSWLDAAAIVKFGIVAALSIPLCWGAAYLVRSLPYAKRVL